MKNPKNLEETKEVSKAPSKETNCKAVETLKCAGPRRKIGKRSTVSIQVTTEKKYADVLEKTPERGQSERQSYKSVKIPMKVGLFIGRNLFDSTFKKTYLLIRIAGSLNRIFKVENSRRYE